MPSNTYIATWLAVTYTGATPVPVEPVEAKDIDAAQYGSARLEDKLAPPTTRWSRGDRPMCLRFACVRADT